MLVENIVEYDCEASAGFWFFLIVALKYPEPHLSFVGHAVYYEGKFTVRQGFDYFFVNLPVELVIKSVGSYVLPEFFCTLVRSLFVSASTVHFPTVRRP